MCGIAGIIAKEKDKQLADKITKMLAPIVHRGPNGSGVESFNDTIAFGHRRLSVIDLSTNGKQPMSYLNKYWITFNGEIYNYLEIKKKLQKEGYCFHNDTDTEVILAAYHNWGKNCVEYFNGMWAFSIYDIEKGEVFCSRDRFGIKPFYFMEEEGDLYFSSEIKQLLEVKENVRANRETLEAYLLNGILDYTEQTMFEGICQLPGGYNLIYSLSSRQYTIMQWYDINNVKENALNFKQNKKLFKEHFFNSVKLRLRADVPVGSCLSGGLDSSAIVCAVHELLKEDQNEDKQFSVSSCFEDKRYDEQPYIDEVVKHTEIQSYKVFPNMSQLFEELDTIIWHMDEPFGSTSIYAQWNVFKEAKEKGLTVMLDGQGADEQLAGYTGFYRVLFIELLKKRKFKQFYHEVQCYRKLRGDTEVISTCSHVFSVLAGFYIPEKIVQKLKIFKRRTIVGSPFPKRFYKNQLVKSSECLYDQKNPRNYIYASMHQGMQALLHYEDRDSMAHSIESRVPFLDYELAECIYSIPLNMKIHEGKTKYIMREALKEIFPSAIYNRYSKLGFVTPEDQWIRENKDFFEKELEQACDILEPVISKEQVLRWYKKNVNTLSRENFTIWRIICAAHWVKVFHVTLT